MVLSIPQNKHVSTCYHSVKYFKKSSKLAAVSAYLLVIAVVHIVADGLSE